MARLVMKFGGTSVGSIERIQNVANIVEREVKAGHEVAVVVSAMSGETDRLVALTKEVRAGCNSARFDQSEYDAVVATGEQVSAGLLAMALQTKGIEARSWAGWQIPLKTNGVHGSARIESIEDSKLGAALGKGQVAIITGFQGIGPDGRITTLGRGGSDTSAVAVAAAISAERCDIFTDVDGIYTTDPRIVQKAHKLDRIAYEEMLELASLGAKVLQTRSVEMAMVHKVPIRVLSSLADPEDPNNGTLVCDEDDIVESLVVSGVTYSRDEARIDLLQVKDQPGIAAKIFGLLADASINVDMIVQNVSRSDKATNMTFTVRESELDHALEVLEDHRKEISCDEINSDAKVVKVSVVGVGMRSHAGVASTMFEALAAKGINIDIISTSEIKISVLIDEEYTELALRTLHSTFGLDAVQE
jgi:aspartate kinase